MASKAGRRGVMSPAQRKTLLLNTKKDNAVEDAVFSSNDSENHSLKTIATVNEGSSSNPSTHYEKIELKDDSAIDKKAQPSPNVIDNDLPDKASDNNAATTLNQLLSESFGTGCLACGADDDHPNLMLCEGCNSEYHTYCLDPPLRSVPSADWFCDKCKPKFEVGDDDELDRLVCALAPSFTSRFGEICWAQAGKEYGWWPACIYDPRLTVGSARQLAKKNLGKKHLVYFFECHDAPFSVLVSSKLTQWEQGLVDDHHLGKSARASGNKARAIQFERALQAATVEHGKPVELRLEWNHPELPEVLPSPKARRKPSKRKAVKSTNQMENEKKKAARSNQTVLVQADRLERSSPNRVNLNSALQALTEPSFNEIEITEDGELYCAVIKKKTISHPAQANSDVGVEDESTGSTSVETVGFVKLDSRRRSTFADARLAIMNDFDDDCKSIKSNWKFYIPSLGPMSVKQEGKLGPMLAFLRSTTSDPRLGNGTQRQPLKVVIIDSESKVSPEGSGTFEEKSTVEK